VNVIRRYNAIRATAGQTTEVRRNATGRSLTLLRVVGLDRETGVAIAICHKHNLFIKSLML